MTRFESAQTLWNAGRKPGGGLILTMLSAPPGTPADLALNMALLLARHNPRTVLLHATPSTVFADLLDRRCALDNLTTAGPEGLRVLAGTTQAPSSNGHHGLAKDDCTRALRHLRQAGDDVLISCGAAINRLTITLALAGDMLILTTTPEPTALTDSYATLKLLATHGFTGRVGVIVGNVHDTDQACAVTRRLTHVVRDFLGLSIEPLGHIIADHHLQYAARDRRPVILAYPECPASGCLRNISDRLAPARQPGVHADGVWSRVAGLFL